MKIFFKQDLFKLTNCDYNL